MTGQLSFSYNTYRRMGSFTRSEVSHAQSSPFIILAGAFKGLQLDPSSYVILLLIFFASPQPTTCSLLETTLAIPTPCTFSQICD